MVARGVFLRDSVNLDIGWRGAAALAEPFENPHLTFSDIVQVKDIPLKPTVFAAAQRGGWLARLGFHQLTTPVETMASGEGGVMTKDIVAQIKEALRDVIDPELGYNIVDLGFLYEVTVKQGDARILMTATTRACPAAAFLKEGVAASATQVEGVRSVDVEMTFDPPWTPSRIDPAVRSSLGFANVN